MDERRFAAPTFGEAITTPGPEGDSVARVERLVDLRERMRRQLSGTRSRAIDVVEMIFENPALTTSRIAETLDITVQSSLHHIRRLESHGMVTEVSGVPGRAKRWVALDVLRILSADDDLLVDHPHD